MLVPTREIGSTVFKERSALNKRNDGRQILPLSNVPGTWCERLEAGKEWRLGASDDPDSGYMRDTRLAAGETLDRHSYGDWRFIMVLDGSFEIAGRTASKDCFLLVRPDAVVDRIVAGPQGAHLLELARTTAGVARRPA